MSQSKDEIRDAYDAASQAYKERFSHELDYKPKDRELLARFATLVGRGNPVLDLGCGPGHTTAHLNSLGVTATGLDLSPGMIAQANGQFPDSSFETGDMLNLQHADGSVAGVLAFYAIVHLTPTQLLQAAAEMHRVLQKKGTSLLSFHVGTGMVHHDDFLGCKAVLDFFFFEIEQVQSALSSAGFANMETIVREPYESEYPSQRCYIFAFKE